LHCAQDLIWDTELADAARADIEECAKDPEHVGSRHDRRHDYLADMYRNAPAAICLR
jgi:hypothetical protein